MALAQDLRNAVLQSALQGKLVKQLETDSSVNIFIDKIQHERKRLINEKKIKKIVVASINLDNVPYAIPANWCWQRIGSLEEINLGFTYRPQYVNKGVYFLSVKDVSNGKIDFSNAKKVSWETYEKASYGSKPKKGDILFGRVCTIGKPQIIADDIPFCIFVSLGFFRDHTNLMNKKYICYWMQSPLFQKQVNENIKGAAQKNLNIGWLKDFYIPIPPVEEQQRIVDRIDELMEKINDYEKIENKLISLENKFPKDMKNALLRASMQGKLTKQLKTDSPIEDMLLAIKKKKEQFIKEKRAKKVKINGITDNDILFTIPKNWRWVRLGDIANLKIGKTPPRTELECWGNDYPWISIADMVADGHVVTTKESISEFGFKSKFNSEIVPADTLIMSFKLTIGRVSILDINAVHNEAIVSLFLYNDINNTLRNYLFKVLTFLSKYGDSRNAIKGNTLNSKSLNNLLIPFPPIEEQKRIVKILEKLFLLCKEL